MRLPKLMIFQTPGYGEFWVSRDKNGNIKASPIIYGAASKEDYLQAVVNIFKDETATFSYNGQKVLSFKISECDTQWEGFEKVYKKLEYIDRSVISLSGDFVSHTHFILSHNEDAIVASGRIYSPFNMEMLRNGPNASCILSDNTGIKLRRNMGKWEDIGALYLASSFYKKMARAYVRSFLEENEILYFTREGKQITLYGLDLNSLQPRLIGEIDPFLFSASYKSGSLLDECGDGHLKRCSYLDWSSAMDFVENDKSFVKHAVDLLSYADNKKLEIVGCSQEDKELAQIIAPHLFTGYVSSPELVVEKDK